MYRFLSFFACKELSFPTRFGMRAATPRGKKAPKKSIVRFPGGVSKSDGGPIRYPFAVRWPGPGGKRLVKWFTNNTQALTWAKLKSEELGATGSDFAGIAEGERAAIAYWRAVVARTAHNPPPSLLDVLRDVGTRWEASQKGCTVAVAVETYLAVKDADGTGKLHKLSLKTRLAHFSRDFGERTLATISTAEISKWILGLLATKSASSRSSTPVPLSLRSKKNFRLILHAFFEWCKAEGTVGENPVTDAAKVKVPKIDPGILKPAEVAVFFAALVSEAPAIVPFWALKFFAGLRDCEASKIDWNLIDLGRNKINLRITSAGKQIRPRVVDIQPALAAFLAPYTKQAGLIAPAASTRTTLFNKARRKLPKKFKTPHNGARHTYATMHLHHFQDAGKTSLQMGHGGSPAVLWAHYASFATDAEAAAFWAIRPETLPQPGTVIPITGTAAEAKPKTPKQKATR